MGAVRSTPPCESHDLAEDTRRPAFSTPRFWASRPAMASGCGSQGRAVEPAGKSVAPGMYRNEGNRLSSRTSDGFTSWGMPSSSTLGREHEPGHAFPNLHDRSLPAALLEVTLPAVAAGPDAMAVATKLSLCLCDSSSSTASAIPRPRATPRVGSGPGPGEMAEDLAVEAPVGAHGAAASRGGVPGQVGEDAAGFLHDHLQGSEIPQRDGGLG